MTKTEREEQNTNNTKAQQTCLDCSAYLPASNNEFTEFGICINDDAFEPFVEEMLKGPIPQSCLALVEEKKFLGENRPGCANFQKIESMEIDDNSPLGQKLGHLLEIGELTKERFEAALFEEQVRQTDWKTMPVDRYAGNLESGRAKEREKAISSLGALIALQNPEALQALLRFLAKLPPPTTIGEVHLKIEILRQLSHTNEREAVAPYIIEELGRTQSNNTTRQWIIEILQFLDRCPLEAIKAPLESVLTHRQFSFKLRRRILDMIS